MYNNIYEKFKTHLILISYGTWSFSYLLEDSNWSWESPILNQWLVETYFHIRLWQSFSFVSEFSLMSSILDTWFCFEVDFYCKLFFIKIGSLFHEKTNLFGLKAVMSNTFSLVKNHRILNAFQTFIGTFNEINIWWIHLKNQLLKLKFLLYIFGKLLPYCSNIKSMLTQQFKIFNASVHKHCGQTDE